MAVSEMIVNLLVILMCVQAGLAATQNPVSDGLTMFGEVLVGCFVVEMLVKCWARGLKVFWRKSLNRLDMVSVAMATLVYALQTCDVLSHNNLIYGAALSLRVVRLLHIFTVIPQLRRDLATVGAILPAVANILFVLFSVLYVAASITTDLFAEVLAPDDPALALTPWFQFRHELHFRSFPSALFTLFQVRCGGFGVVWCGLMWSNALRCSTRPITCLNIRPRVTDTSVACELRKNRGLGAPIVEVIVA